MALDVHYRLETPEHVEIEFDLAGPGSRFCAWVIDALLMVLVAVVLMIIVFSLLGGLAVLDDWFSGRGLGRGLAGWALAIAIVALFLLVTGYHILFESLMRGQTPGKKQIGIRAIRDDGTGMTFVDVLIRNLLRMVDFLPVFYGLGGFVCLMHPMQKRIGDLAAGTIVVKEASLDYRARTDRKTPMQPAVAAVPNAELTAAERQLLLGFLQRRDQLLIEARLALADRLARPLWDKYGGYWHTAESYIERLLQGRHHES